LTIRGERKVRVVLDISGRDRRVSRVDLRLKRVGGSSPLTVTLRDDRGRIVERGRIAASRIPIGDPSDRRDPPSRVSLRMRSSHVLKHGRRYTVGLSTARDTEYNTFAIREGTVYGYAPATYFRDGRAQETDGAGGWVAPWAWSGRLDQADLQLHLR
jgi:hypothetical protein